MAIIIRKEVGIERKILSDSQHVKPFDVRQKRHEKEDLVKKKYLFILISVVFFLSIASSGLCQQTGSIKGTITDADGLGLPGVSVTLSSPAMQGIRSFVATADGNFRFPSLPPGVYTIKFTLSGFQTKERPGIKVSLGSTTTVNVQMEPSSLEEEVTVTAASPIVDVESSDIAVTYSKELIASVPIRRDVLDIYQAAPATVPRDSSNDYQKSASVAGGGLHDSKIAVDGVDLVDNSRGYISADISFDAIEEVEMVIGGHKAESGQVSAGFLNVVTKSGGNQLSGSVTMGGSSDALAQVVVPQEQIDAFGLSSPQLKKYKYDIGLALGGPIIRDKVWFFIAPRYNTFEQSTFFIPYTDPEGYAHPAYPNNRKDYIALGKVTVQLTSNIKWFAMYQYNRGKEYPEMWSVTKTYSPLESQKVYDDSSHTLSSVLTYVFDQNTFMEAKFGMVRRLMALTFSFAWEGPPDRAYHMDKTSLYEWGMPYSNIYDYYRDNFDIGAVFTRFQDDFLGADHELKAGIDYSRNNADRQGSRPNPYYYYWNNGQPWYYSDVEPYKGQFRIYSGSTTTQLSHKAGMWRMSFFLQDTINIGSRLTVNVGLRYDDSHGYVPAKHWEGWDDIWENGLANVLLPEIFQPAGSTLDSPPIDDAMVFRFLSPRIGFSYDLLGNGKTLFKASYARYGEALFTTSVERLIPLQDRTVTFTWWDDNRNGLFDLPPIDRYQPGSYQLYDTDIEPLRKQIASDIKTPYTDEFTLGIIHEISDDFSIGLNYINKSGKRFLGQRNLNIAKDSEWWIPYTVTDPGDDGMIGTGDEQNLTVYMLRSDAPSNFIQVDNIDEAWRKYWGFTLLFNKRMSHGWMFNGSIAVNKAYGNFPHGYLTYSGNQNFWDPNMDIYREGRLEYDRPLIVKLMSTIELPFRFLISGYFRHYSGGHFERQVTVYFPSTVDGYKPRSSSVTVNAEPEGNRDLMSETFLDLRLEKAFQVGELNVGFWLDVYNLFGHWNFTWVQSQLTGGYIYSDGSYARYPRFGQPSAVFGTRELAFGARIRF